MENPMTKRIKRPKIGEKDIASLVSSLQVAQTALAHLAAHPAFEGDAPEFNEGGIGYVASKVIKDALKGYCRAPDKAKIKARLEYLRGEIEAERISYGEIAELQSLAEYIDKGDVQLLQWAGVPEFPEDEDSPPVGQTISGTVIRPEEPSEK
jgi:hypothetical protein